MQSPLQRISQVFLILFFSSLLFSGCAQRRVYYPYPPAPNRYEHNRPPRQEQPRNEGIERRQTHPSTRQEQEEQQQRFSPTRRGPAYTLYRDAERAITKRKYNQAEMLLNRALRIEPRNGWYWHAMGKAKYARGSYDQAVQFCLKSNSLAGNDMNLKHSNQTLLNKAYSKIRAHKR